MKTHFFPKIDKRLFFAFPFFCVYANPQNARKKTVAREGKLWFTKEDFVYLVFNSIHTCVFGESVSVEDERAPKYNEGIERWMKAVLPITGIRLAFPQFHGFLSLIGVFPKDTKRKGFLHAQKQMDGLLLEWLEKWEKERGEGAKSEESGGLLDYMYPEFTKKVRGRDSKAVKQKMVSDLFALFTASMDTTVAFFETATLVLAGHPKIQNEIYEELVEVFGKSESGISLATKKIVKLNKFRAFIYEVMRRWHPPLLGVAREVEEGIWVETSEGEKYYLPKGCFVMQARRHTMVYDTEAWTRGRYSHLKGKIDLENINLELWLDKSGKFSMHPAFIGFSEGKKDCAGRSLAIKHIYAALSTLIIRYEFLGENGDPSKASFKITGDLVYRIDPSVPLLCKLRCSA